MTKRLANVLLALDLDGTADAAWELATSLDLPDGSMLHVCHVARVDDAAVRKHPDAAAKDIETAHANVQAFLAKQLGSSSNPLCSRLDVHIALGAPAEQIVQLAVDVAADLIVLGTNDKKGMSRLVLGSVSTEVFRTAPCSVLVARRADYAGHARAPEIQAARADGAQTGSAIHAPPAVRYRSRPFSQYNANLFPTGIPRKDVF